VMIEQHEMQTNNRGIAQSPFRANGAYIGLKFRSRAVVRRTDRLGRSVKR